MLRKFVCYILLAFLTLSNSIICALDKDHSKRNSLESLGSVYQNFLNFAGSKATDCASIEAEASLLFAANFRKTVNGQTVLEGGEKLGAHLWEFRENLGRWKINVDIYPLIPSIDRTSCITVSYIVESTDIEEPIRQIVIAILKIDTDEKIVELFEVYHSIETTNSGKT